MKAADGWWQFDVSWWSILEWVVTSERKYSGVNQVWHDQGGDSQLSSVELVSCDTNKTHITFNSPPPPSFDTRLSPGTNRFVPSNNRRVFLASCRVGFVSVSTIQRYNLCHFQHTALYKFATMNIILWLGEVAPCYLCLSLSSIQQINKKTKTKQTSL